MLGIVIGFFILKYLIRKKFLSLDSKSLDKFLTWIIVSMFIGARLFYVFVYNWAYYAENLLEVLAVWRGGLSFFGAVFGMLVAVWIFSRRYRLNFYQLTDCLVIAGTPGLFFGRIGNFINGELYGRVTDSWVGMVFPMGGPFTRHPSQLYEAIFEGIILSVISFFIYRREKFYGPVSTIFLVGYGLFRFILEFVREPDVQIGFLTLDQILSLGFFPLAVILYLHARRLNFKIITSDLNSSFDQAK